MTLKRKASTVLRCEPAVAYEVVSDYAAYMQWLPGIRGSQVLAQENNFAIAELEFTSMPGLKVTVECVHAPTQMVLARSLTGNEPAVRIEWKIKPFEVGHSQVTLKMEGPLSFTSLFNGYYRSFLDPGRGLAALSGAVAAYSEGPSGDKIIEIVETEEGLICWYRGNKYQMKEIA